MSTAQAGAVGHPPTVKVGITEKAKYEKMWAIDDYRKVAPGEQTAMVFLEQAKPWKDSTCIDFGCGTGRGGLMIALMGGLKVTLLDFASNCLDEEVRNTTVTQAERLQFIEHDLNKLSPVHAMYGYCTDVMEHIPPEEVDRVLANILLAAQHVFFQISTQPDVMGERIGEPLHLTVESYEWWMKKFREQECVIHWSHNEQDQYCFFYVSSWTSLEEVEYDGVVNTELEQVKENIRENVKGNWQMVHPHPMQSTEVMLICGGPSLNDYTDEIIEQRANGMPMITTNGTYNWAIANGMTPSMQLIIDGREFNKRFVTPVVDDCKYMIASQCHPSVLEGLPEDRTYLWHVSGRDEEIEKILDEAYEIWFPVPGGSTVTLRGLCLLRMLGFHKIHMYGFDSCYRDGEHHAYEQAENNYKNYKIPVGCGGTKTFLCDGWMYSQAKEFIQMVGLIGDEIQLDIKGDGLIAHIVETGAKLAALDEENEE
jgi:hypothetical protein